MHELRKDPLLGKWIAVLSDSKGPDFYLEKNAEHPAHGPDDEGSCILCAGREHEAGREIFAIRGGNPPDWYTRVIPQTSPLFQIEGELGRRGVGMYDRMNSIGANEIIIESPQHTICAEDSGIAQMSRVITTYKYRLSELEKDPRLRYTHLCKDCGRAAGEGYRHPHSQIIATPVIPKGIKDELDGAKAYFYYKERCIFCDIADEEMRTGKRIIMDTANFIAFTPFAPRFPFEYWILPKKHNCAFQDIRNEEVEDLGFILMSTLKKMKYVLHDPPYSYVLHTAPNRVPRKDHWHTLGDDFHWHIEVMPQLLKKSGFELSSEFYIMATSPEDAADYLKGASPL
ncbi:MAG: galactose-1-phosphate uridylyltransferase [Nitrospirae bacterium]|nr:galactose-1-phosphate uridylyltransferase [Nitrospirota bacterium]MCL5236709.1 galactose-1-phosphate uridylyltransferase [Nitrospirota bacterium]